jgi:glutamine synthetase
MEDNTSETLARAKDDNVRFVSLQFTDIFGVIKNVTIGVNHLEEALEKGKWFDGSSIEGFARICESDMFLMPDQSTYAVIPWLNSPDGNTARFICDVHTADGKPFPGDPRFVLKRSLSEAKKLGYDYYTGPEYEFFLFRRENGAFKPLPHDRGGYFDLNMDLAYEIRRDMSVALERFGLDVETAHHEVAVGQHEIDIKYGQALRTADNALTMKFVIKAVAEKHGLLATFMPKPIFGINGSGMHVHQSLFKGDENAFYSESGRFRLSDLARSFVAGQLAHIRSMCAITAPTVNSYKRLTPGYEAPVYVSWASVNRSALIRVPAFQPSRPKAARIELRCPDPSSNIYLAFASMLGAGLDGVRKGMVPPEPVEESLYDFDDAKRERMRIEQLPSSLNEALEEYRKSALMKEVMGSLFEKYYEAKKAEWDEFRLHVAQWEIDRYAEIY